MLRVEVILGIIAASIAILGFIAKAWANIRRGQRIRRYSADIARTSDEEFRRLQEEIQAAGEITAENREETEERRGLPDHLHNRPGRRSRGGSERGGPEAPGEDG